MFFRTPKLYCDSQDCPAELLHPPEDCNVNSSLVFTLQVHILFEHHKVLFFLNVGHCLSSAFLPSFFLLK